MISRVMARARAESLMPDTVTLRDGDSAILWEGPAQIETESERFVTSPQWQGTHTFHQMFHIRLPFRAPREWATVTIDESPTANLAGRTFTRRGASADTYGAYQQFWLGGVT